MLALNRAAFFASYGLSSQLPPSDRWEIVFSGRSNVGKSSMLNRLFSRKKLAKVSSVPGKTATINFYQAGDAFLVDLPGYGYAKTSRGEKQRWNELIHGYLDEDRYFALVVQLIDLRHPPTQLDLSMVQFLIDQEFPFVVALTKADKLNTTQRKERLEAIRKELPYGDEITMIPFSSQTGEGSAQLTEILEEVCQYSPLEDDTAQDA